MTLRFPVDYPIISPSAPNLVVLGDDGTHTGVVSLAGLLAAVGNVTAETNRAEAAEAVLQAQITTNDGSLTTLSAGLTSETTRAEAAEAAVAALPIAGNSIGGQSIDNGVSTVISLTRAQLAQGIGSALPAAVIANNINFGTVGIFWTAADAVGVAGATVNPFYLLGIAVTWSSTNKRPVRFGAGLYNFGANTLSVSVPNVWLILDEGAWFQTQNPTSHGYSLFYVKPAATNFRVHGGIFGPPADTYLDCFSGLILTTPNIQDWRTLCGGNWAGITNYGTWQFSATQLAVVKTNVVYFDALPANYSTLGALVAVLNVQPMVFWNNRLINAGSYIANGSAVTAVTIGSWSGYQATLTPGPGASWAVAANSWTPKAAIPRGVGSSMTPFVMQRPAIPAPSGYLLASAPVFYVGGIFIFIGDDPQLFDVEIRNISSGRGILNYGNRLRVIGGRGIVTDGTAGSANIRISGGDGARVVNYTNWSGDQGLQFVPGTVWTGNAFNSTSNLDITDSWYVSCNAISLGGGGPTANAGISVSNLKQLVKWTVSTSIGTGNIIQMPLSGGLPPTGLTKAQLQNSAPSWGAGFTYNQIGQVVNNPGSAAGELANYTLVQAGVSNVNGTGPTGTGTNIADGTCLWNYVAGSDGNGITVFVTGANGYIAAPSIVVSYSDNGTTATMTLQPPAGYTQAVKHAIAPGAVMNFTPGGIPDGILTNNIKNSGWANCVLMSPSGYNIGVKNSDTCGIMDLYALYCTCDNLWAIPEFSSYGAAIQLLGSYQGEVSFTALGCAITVPQNYGVYGLGLLGSIVIEDCVIEPNQVSTLPVIYLAGASRMVLRRNRIWGSGTYDVVQLGDGPSVDSLGDTIPASTYDADIEGNWFFAVPDTYACVQLAYGGNFRLRGNTVYPATTGGIDQAKFLNITRNFGPGFVNFDDNNLTYINNPTPINTSPSGVTLSPGALNQYSASALAPPAPVVGTSGTFTPTVTCANNPSNLSVAYTAQACSYLQIGNLTFVQVSVSFTPTFTAGQASGNVLFTMPFAALSNGLDASLPVTAPLSAFQWGGTTPTQCNAVMNTGQPNARIEGFLNNGAPMVLNMSNLTSGTAYTISFSGVYAAV